MSFITYIPALVMLLNIIHVYVILISKYLFTKPIVASKLTSSAKLAVYTDYQFTAIACKVVFSACSKLTMVLVPVERGVNMEGPQDYSATINSPL